MLNPLLTVYMLLEILLLLVALKCFLFHLHMKFETASTSEFLMATASEPVWKSENEKILPIWKSEKEIISLNHLFWVALLPTHFHCVALISWGKWGYITDLEPPKVLVAPAMLSPLESVEWVSIFAKIAACCYVCCQLTCPKMHRR